MPTRFTNTNLPATTFAVSTPFFSYVNQTNQRYRVPRAIVNDSSPLYGIAKTYMSIQRVIGIFICSIIILVIVYTTNLSQEPKMLVTVGVLGLIICILIFHKGDKHSVTIPTQSFNTM